MARVDNDPKVRELSRLLWERAGRPSGREHEFWALASWTLEGENDNVAYRRLSAAR